MSDVGDDASGREAGDRSDGQRVLVTGGCGYIGSALVPRLLDDPRVSEVVVLDSLADGSPAHLAGCVGDRLDFRRGDVRDYGAVESATRGVDAVIHLAAITGAASTHDRREETFAVNRDGTENVLTAAGKFDVDSVVVASSCNNYGRAASRDIDETTEQNPLNPYAESKVACERLLDEAVEAYDFDATALRMSTNYGWSPGVRFNLVVNHFVFRGLTDRPLTVYGDGSNWRPFIHVRDAARAYLDAALDPDAWPERVYNVGSNEGNYRISEIAEIVREELERDLDVTYLEDEQPGPSYHVNFDRLAETGFETEWTLLEGVRDIASELTGTEAIQG
ncbi:NAD-dependent epimerase/dehydratase family protein [Halorubrum ezzemoulense]|uniref:NAD-dependent epimerase/dehydratase family protein n=1 Tax=Halorubrum ezzemoulense TaxID=337243 RepID=UPI00232E36BE|nr:NAD-dependent epimerase/dehydratase family protein [Halorubrum ezzemoulense]MDB2225670.1 NAD-dependent epimerase/dehydratase family protein [Halorubrum ezzemoulense]